MNELLLAVALTLFLTILVGMVRVLRGPSPFDRMLAAQLFGTTGVAILLLFAHVASAPALRDVALVFALLAALAALAFVRRAVPQSPAPGGRETARAPNDDESAR